MLLLLIIISCRAKWLLPPPNLPFLPPADMFRSISYLPVSGSYFSKNRFLLPRFASFSSNYLSFNCNIVVRQDYTVSTTFATAGLSSSPRPVPTVTPLSSPAFCWFCYCLLCYRPPPSKRCINEAAAAAVVGSVPKTNGLPRCPAACFHRSGTTFPPRFSLLPQMS